MNAKKIELFDVVNTLLMACILAAMLYPMLNVVSVSLSGTTKLGLGLWPEDPTLKNYGIVLRNSALLTGFLNTLLRVALGVAATLFVTLLMAFPLAKKDLPFRRLITMFVVFTMFFNGGMIPNYIVVRSLGLIDSRWALILPRLVDTFALIVMRNFLMTIPESLEEAAKIDGAGYFTILFRIVVPISLPIIATVVLWTAVWHWNSWFDAMIYISTQSKQVLQLVLRRIVIEGTASAMSVSMDQADSVSNPDMIKAATIIVSTLPILCVYPFLQKYFVKGIVVGSVKE